MKSYPNTQRLLLAITVLLAIALGCDSSGPKTIQVTGSITQSGQPIEAAIVVFTPTSGDGSQVAAQGETDADGNFSLSTYVGGDNYKQGIAPGEYDVSVTKLEVVQDMRRQPKNLLPKKYSLPKTSGLSASVSEDGKTHFEFDL